MNVDEPRLKLAQACRVLAHTGLAEDILGHVSFRAGEGRAWVRCRARGESGLLFTVPDDIHAVSLEREKEQLPNGYAYPSEFPIHREILRKRPEVTAVVHAHPPAVVALDLAAAELRPIVGAYNIPAMRLAAAGIPVYRRSVLINDTELGLEVCEAIGDAPACVLRGHGVVTVGATVEEAVVRALNVDALARMTLQVAALGAKAPEVPPQDVALIPDLGSTFNDTYVWQYQMKRLAHAGLALGE